MISNFNHECLQSSGEMQSFVREIEDSNQNENDDELNMV